MNVFTNFCTQYTTNKLLPPISSLPTRCIEADFHIKEIIPTTNFRSKLLNFYLKSNSKIYKNVVLYPVRSCKLRHLVVQKSIKGNYKSDGPQSVLQSVGHSDEPSK